MNLIGIDAWALANNGHRLNGMTTKAVILLRVGLDGNWRDAHRIRLDRPPTRRHLHWKSVTRRDAIHPLDRSLRTGKKINKTASTGPHGQWETPTSHQSGRSRNRRTRTKNQEPRTKNQEPRTKNQDIARNLLWLCKTDVDWNECNRGKSSWTRGKKMVFLSSLCGFSDGGVHPRVPVRNGPRAAGRRVLPRWRRSGTPSRVGAGNAKETK